MGSSVFSCFLVVLVVLLGTQQWVVHGDNNNNISWEDFMIDGRSDFYNGMNRSSSSSSGNGVIFVAQDGSGDSVTVQGAVDLVPNHNKQRIKIFILPGIYRERVYVPKTKPFISFIGIENTETVITSNTKASDKDAQGREIGTFNTATVDVESDYFCATGITIENTIVAKPGGEGMQAVALKVSGDKSMFFRVRLVGSQDTLLDLEGTHYFYQCYIQGSIDFICGNAKSLYEECTLNSTAKTSGAIAAQRRESADEDTGFSFVNCTVTGTGKIYLGRAWGQFSRTIYSHSHMDDIINHNGWSDWGDASRRKTVSFGEYQCSGKGAKTTKWVPWAKSFTHEEAKPFLSRNFIDGHEWLSL